METKNSTYLILTIILLILSGVGGYFLFQNLSTKSQTTYNSDTVPKIELIPTDIIESDSESSPSSVTITPTSTSSAKTTITPTKKVTITPTKVPTKIPTAVVTKTPTAIPTTASSSDSSSLQTYSSVDDGFSVDYSGTRKIYQDTESSGNRYTFYSLSGNFAIHVSPSDKWSWSNPDRQFSTGFTVSGQPTFRYDIATQTIVDLQSSTKNYTIQCVHGGKESLKTECESFIASFKLL